MWIYTASKKLLIVSIATAFCFASAQCVSCQEIPVLSTELKRLGHGGDDLGIIKELARTPQASVPLLIDGLHPIHEARILNGQENPDAEHVLWSIRALRNLTGGKDFCGKTSHQFGGSEQERNRKYWIYFRHKTCVSFFAMWPSRGSVYIAPEDAQKEIIQKWKDWIKKDGSRLAYQPLRDPKPGGLALVIPSGF
jgi:hypothetical protein